MATRAIGSLTLSFGLVAIPVKIYSAVQSGSAISFNLLTKDGSRVKQQYVSAKDETTVVARDEMLKGYEITKDNYVTFTAEEIKALEEVGTKGIEINEFVPNDSIESVYLDKTYYLAPLAAAAKPYALFMQAMQESGQVGIGRWANRGKGHIVAIRANNGVLEMQQLHFDSEVRDIEFEVPAPKQPIKQAELDLAKRLIQQSSVAKYDPSAYADEHTARVEAAIQAKVEGKPITVEVDATESEPVDLMAALQASLEKAA